MHDSAYLLHVCGCIVKLKKHYRVKALTQGLLAYSFG